MTDPFEHLRVWVDLVADSSRSAAYAFDERGSLTIVRPGGTPECCFGGMVGSAFSLSPDGTQVAYTPDGRELAVADASGPADESPPKWTSSDEITAAAFADGWIAVAHGGVVTLVSVDGTEVHDLAGFGAASVATLDWSE